MPSLRARPSGKWSWCPDGCRSHAGHDSRQASCGDDVDNGAPPACGWRRCSGCKTSVARLQRRKAYCTWGFGNTAGVSARGWRVGRSGCPQRRRAPVGAAGRRWGDTSLSLPIRSSCARVGGCTSRWRQSRSPGPGPRCPVMCRPGVHRGSCGRRGVVRQWARVGALVRRPARDRAAGPTRVGIWFRRKAGPSQGSWR
ncbi:hypothetical protein LAUMK4_05654 [Mycobacterium persicum]|uniref:Uncharacterized protein n=1 Tax=Mycobacterium persicum TaxID=1487726 RepID=A0ABY6RSB7_9MYCO|nr:Uncharacterised protein [Mycobacteroides abscessus subsp. abscessus]VBA31995.1 hypothetical protein LAUMK4_05654 [Mycobacterium persicum]